MKYKDTNSTKKKKDQTYISSNLPIETAKKHNGCSGWTTTKKKEEHNSNCIRNVITLKVLVETTYYNIVKNYNE